MPFSTFLHWPSSESLGVSVKCGQRHSRTLRMAMQRGTTLRKGKLALSFQSPHLSLWTQKFYCWEIFLTFPDIPEISECDYTDQCSIILMAKD